MVHKPDRSVVGSESLGEPQDSGRRRKYGSDAGS